jgi:hypothetical protein
MEEQTKYKDDKVKNDLRTKINCMNTCERVGSYCRMKMLEVKFGDTSAVDLSQFKKYKGNSEQN